MNAATLALPALTKSTKTVRKHLERGGRAAYRFVDNDTGVGPLVREIFVVDGELVVGAWWYNPEGGDGPEIINPRPVPEAVDGWAAYLIADESGDIAADTEGRWID